jgi:hypothetical protein
MCTKYRRQRLAKGTPATASALRKRGVPLWLALRILGVAPHDSIHPEHRSEPQKKR